MRLSKKQRSVLYQKYDGKCAYCGEDLPEKGWHADHAEPIYRESDFDHEKKRFFQTGKIWKPELDTFENLMPSCQSCNLYKGGMRIETFRNELSKQVERARKNSINFRLAEKFGLVKALETEVIFHFEKRLKEK